MDNSLKNNIYKMQQILESISKDTEMRIKNMNSNKMIAQYSKAVTYSLSSDLCMGCGTCVCVCPVQALSLFPDKWGYYRSTLDYEKCINCGKCSQRCPAITLPDNFNSDNPSCFAFVASDEELLDRSSSGGIFSLLANLILEKNGFVVGAAWQDDFSVSHIMISNKNELYKLQKSKYLQSYTGDIYMEIKKKLEEDSYVLFSGCACQVAGLKSYLHKRYEKLLLIDIFCSHAPSALFFKKYIEDSFPDGIKKYEFRNKTKGWNCSCIKIENKGGATSIRQGAKEDNYQRVFHNHTMCSKHCENCKYQSLPRLGDITIGDFWKIGEKDKSINTKNGVSAILCNNSKGERYIQSISKKEIAIMKQVPLEWLGGNGYIKKGKHNYSSPNRDKFYKVITTMQFSDAVDYALKPNHGYYKKVYKTTPTHLQYDVERLHFQFDPKIWEENLQNNHIRLTVKTPSPKPRQFATLPLSYPLIKGEKYHFSLKCMVHTQKGKINFYIKDSGSNLYQVIFSLDMDTNESWKEIESDFVPDSNLYDEFMIAASQITGEERYILFEYISIEKRN